MSATRIGRLLLALGVLVGGAAGIAMLLGFEPARLPRAVLNIAVYKLTFLAALAILAAGATVLRHAWREGSHTALPRSARDQRAALAAGARHRSDPDALERRPWAPAGGLRQEHGRRGLDDGPGASADGP